MLCIFFYYNLLNLYISLTILNKDILRQRTKDIEVKRHCIKLLERFGSFKYTRNVLEELDSTARHEIERLGGNPLLVKILDELKNWDTIDAPKDPLTGTF